MAQSFNGQRTTGAFELYQRSPAHARSNGNSVLSIDPKLLGGPLRMAQRTRGGTAWTSLRPNIRSKKIILLARDPKDVVVSAYFHKSKRKKKSV